jgi:hypothetical protein
MFRLVSNESKTEKMWCSGVLVYPENNKTSFGKYIYVPIRVTVRPIRDRSSAHPATSQLDLCLSIEKSGRDRLSSKFRNRWRPFVS